MKKLITIILGIFIGTISYSQVTIYQIQGQAASSPYEGQVVTTTGIVTGVYSNQGFVIQDGEGAWNGVYVYNPGNSQTVGNEIELTAMVSEYYGLTELTNPTGVTVLSVGNVLPQATVLSTAAINDEAYEGVLVMVDNASCTNPNLMYGEWEIDDGSGPCVVDDMGVVFTPDPGLQYAVTGPLFYSFDFYKIEPRSETDIEILNDLFFTTLPVQINPEKDTITLQWETNVAATTEIFFGLTPELELGHTSVPGMSTNHLLKWSLNVQPSMVYYIRPFSVAESDTTPDFTRSYATVSNSTGMVKLYFNHKVDHSVATITPAIWAPNIADTVTHYLNLAQYTLDITMYEQESAEIVAAINNAYNRGVQVRYITDDVGNNPALADLNPNIPVLYGNQNAIMHNKFIIIDTDLEMDCWVITGSLNHTHANLGWDYNNMICLQDQSLAKSFTLEFEEMWGGNGPDPDPAQAKFGAEKRDNTPHLFRIGDMPVELYFSPSDHTTGKIEKVINEAVNEFVFGMMVFTENSLGTAVKNAFDRGVEVTGIIDYVEYSGSEYGYLKSNGINVRNYVNPDGTSWPDGPVFHHKYAIADYNSGSQNPVAITGSHNWSASAESINDENTLIIHSEDIANQFYQEFTQRFNEQLTPLAFDDDTTTQMNESVDILFLENDFFPEDVTAVAEIVSPPLHGNAGINGQYMIYDPDDGFSGVDSISYHLYNFEQVALADTAWVVVGVGETGITKIIRPGLSIQVRTGSGAGLLISIQAQYPEQLNVSVYDNLGRAIFENTLLVPGGYSDARLPVNLITTGIYFIRFFNGENEIVKKVFVN